MKRPDRCLSRADMVKAIEVAVNAGLPMIVWGPAGEGKTRMIEQVAARLGRHLEVVLGSIREPADFSGLPMRVDDGVVLVPPAWARRASQAPVSLVFLDEVTTCSPQVQAVLLGVVLDRRVGDLVMPPSVAIVCAANPAEIAASGVDLAAPLANRFCHLWFEASVDDWTAGMVSGWELDAPIEASAASDAEVARWQGLVAEFIRRRPDVFRRLPPHLVDRGGAWPSPRSWDMAARLAATAQSMGCSETIIDALVSGCVGSGAAIEFLVYVSELDLPDPDELLADPRRARPLERADRTLAMVASVAAAVQADLTYERWAAAWEVMAAVARHGSIDAPAVACRRLAQLADPAWPAPDSASVFLPILKKVGWAR